MKQKACAVSRGDKETGQKLSANIFNTRGSREPRKAVSGIFNPHPATTFQKLT